MNAKDIYDKVCSGDPISDNDIRIGIAHYKQLGGLLSVSGPVFKLAANEANRIRYSLEGFQQARARHG
jgi:hypothetical protein